MKKNKVIEQVKNNKNEFVEFLKSYNVIQLAVGVVVGNAAKDVVTTIANSLIMPIIGLLTPSGNWQDWAMVVGGASFEVGQVLSSLLQFVIVALVVFVVISKLLKMEIKK